LLSFVVRQQVYRLSLIGLLIFCAATTTTKENAKIASFFALLFHLNCFMLHGHDFDLNAWVEQARFQIGFMTTARLLQI